jgi:glycosyltransferase involved in cell wall biosynthesis
MNRQSVGSCPILTLRKGAVVAAADEELLHYPAVSSGNPFVLPKPLIEDLTINRHQLDGVVLHGTYNPPMATMATHLTKIRLPYLFIPHDPYVSELRHQKRWRKLAYWHLFEKRMMAGARAVQLLDESHEPPLRALGVTTPTVVIPNGCELSMLDEIPSTARIPGTIPHDIRILYFGRMDRHHKGLDLLLGGFAQALQTAPTLTQNVTLVMTGNDWTDRQALERLASDLNIAHRVNFTGRRPESAMQIVADADLVILPSRFDGFGLCIVEAMLASRPVIASSGAGVATHVRNAGGGWTPAPTVESIAQSLLDALTIRNQWPQMGQMNQEYVRNHLTWDQIAVRTIAVYQDLFS